MYFYGYKFICIYLLNIRTKTKNIQLVSLNLHKNKQFGFYAAFLYKCMLSFSLWVRIEQHILLSYKYAAYILVFHFLILLIHTHINIYNVLIYVVNPFGCFNSFIKLWNSICEVYNIYTFIYVCMFIVQLSSWLWWVISICYMYE